MNRFHKRLFASHRICGRVEGLLRTFASDRTGASAVELALLWPFMLLIYIGLFEVNEAFNQDRKISRTASSIADLVAQTQTISLAELVAVTDAGDALMAPYPTTGRIGLMIASVSIDANDNATTDWSYSSGTGAAWTAGDPPGETLPDEIVQANTSFIVAKAEYSFAPSFPDLWSNPLFSEFGAQDSILGQSITLSDTVYLRPRLVSQIACSDCP
ncbi:Flp pilus assembly protein TadG [Roseibium denhamense]|uniref:Flp pilus assembly protein TadG n=2 Tax=Roseibium denhamense TaxID=76305 RepID=A0ABY1NZP5_9HYPH|nr:Flp pilus assembly protein TadG [Roseibium denhamense]